MPKSIVPLAVVLVIAGIGAAAYSVYKNSANSAENQEVESMEGTDTESASPSTVTLSSVAADSLNLKISEAKVATLTPSTVISGRLQVDDTTHISINTACEGIVKELLVLPGQHVESGDVVAVISSPEVGAARAEVAQHRASVRLAEQRQTWTSKVKEGVNKLVSRIRASVPPEEIERSLKDASLGQYRERLVSAYSRSRLAHKLDSSIRGAVASGAVTGRVQSEREAEVQAADAALEAILEQSMFEMEQASMQDDAALEKANQELQVSLERLQLLLGPWASNQDLNSGGEASGSLSTVNLVSPISGTVQEHLASKFERVNAGQSLLVIADTTSLWAVADVREKDWGATATSVGDPVEVSTPLVPDQTFEAKLIIIGPNVNALTGAMPVIASISGADAKLKPGMFVRMRIRSGQSRKVLTIPESAIAMHEGNHFVFIPENDNCFRRADVIVGDIQDGTAEILSGIEQGTPVVASGVFKLQSELLLAGEEE